MKKYLLIVLLFLLSNTAYWLSENDQYCVDTYWVEIDTHEVASDEFDTSTPFYDWKARLEQNQTKHIDTLCDDTYDLIYSYMYETGWFDRYPVRKSLAENWYCDYTKKSPAWYIRKVWAYYSDMWICQLNRYYKADFWNTAWAFENPLRQVDRCLYEFSINTTFYANASQWDKHIIKWLR